MRHFLADRLPFVINRFLDARDRSHLKGMLDHVQRVVHCVLEAGPELWVFLQPIVDRLPVDVRRLARMVLRPLNCQRLQELLFF
jgi:hypothetical protein